MKCYINPFTYRPSYYNESCPAISEGTEFHTRGLTLDPNKYKTNLVQINMRYIYRLSLYIDPVTLRLHTEYITVMINYVFMSFSAVQIYDTHIFICRENDVTILNPGIRSHGVTIKMKPLKECFMDGAIHFYIYIVL